MSLLGDDPLTQIAFSIYENKGVFAVLLGSGLSRAAEIPTGWEITLDLIRRVAVAQGANEQPDWADWYRNKTGQKPSYSALLEELTSSPEERRSILHSYIEPTDEDREAGRKIPTVAHHAIADLVRDGCIRVIVTTNFDRLMENALRERGIEPTVITSVDVLTGAERITHSACYILKLHGDYKDSRILNTDEELRTYPDEYNALLSRIFDEYGLIICGWSGEWDHALKVALQRAPNRRYPVYWTARGNLSIDAQDLTAHRRARVVPITDADTFFKALRERIETLAQTHRQNPLSTELLVNTTKRYLAKSEYRIQLNELFDQETNRLLTLIDEARDFSPTEPWDKTSFQTRIRKYESVTEPLARMAGVLGRWGDDSEFSIVLDIIHCLYRHAEKIGGGLNLYLNIRSYPAVLVFTAYGLALTRAERWVTLHRLFSSVIDKQGRQSKRLIETLFLFVWSGTENNAWKNIEGLEKKKTALSDHLFALFTEWGKSFVTLTADFELLFARFELLGSLAYLEPNEMASVQAELNKQQFVWMPVGRVIWQESIATKLISEMQADPMNTALMKAHFAKGNNEFLKVFVANFELMSRQTW